MANDTKNSELFQALASLAEQVWILKDRQIVMEAVLADQGIDIREQLDRFQPDAELSAQLDTARQEFIGAVMASFGEGHAGS